MCDFEASNILRCIEDHHVKNQISSFTKIESSNTICLMNSGSSSPRLGVTSLWHPWLPYTWPLPSLGCLSTFILKGLYCCMCGTFLSFLSFFRAVLLLVFWWIPPAWQYQAWSRSSVTYWPVHHGYQVISMHTLKGFDIGKYLFTYNTLLSIINGYFLG